MFRSFKETDPLYYAGLVFMIFPFGGIAWFGYPVWTIIPSTAFSLAYLAIIHIKNRYQKTIALLWFYLLGYIVWMSCFIEGSMMWFFFFLTNLLVWRFGDKIKSYRFISFLLGIFVVIVIGMVRSTSLFAKVYCIIIPIFILVMLFTQYQNLQAEELREELYQQNKTINLLAAENERNRIGRDLHDTLGHTFAMMTLKTELALKQLDKNNTPAVQKELEDLRTISQTSMKEVRELINNLKYRTVSEELTTIQEMFTLSKIDLEVDNQIKTDQLAPVMHSTITMILRELATNIIKHAQARHCQIRIEQADQLTIEVTDDGVGFDQLTGEELHSIKERLQFVKGQVAIVSKANPTTIRISLDQGDVPS
ncbi:sensor histidine kinase [Streptococcus merionis]|uniref:histidine kinase n=1 Tax=Streptococcus merionis TaxID=400065 RepID=A0A239T0P1_9STRE|nr:sensor histidine kinase [Streptococcus merionis]SNU90524.1 histidine kinase [Streptococcus merionis]